jgi:hypothetical protein
LIRFKRCLGAWLTLKPVGSLLELNGITLHAPYVDVSGSMGLAQFTFHAMLAIDTGGATEWRNWSYWHQHFDRLTPEQAKAAGLYSLECEPLPDFISKLPFLAK